LPRKRDYLAGHEQHLGAKSVREVPFEVELSRLRLKRAIDRRRPRAQNRLLVSFLPFRRLEHSANYK
jgi:hypothetical protein